MKRILVYDRQQGYYDFLKLHFDCYSFELQSDDKTYKKYDALIFIMQDVLEGLEFARLFRNNLPVALGVNRNNGMVEKFDTVSYFSLGDTKAAILKKISVFLKNL